MRNSNYHMGISLVIAFLAFHFWMRLFASIRDGKSNVLSVIIPVGLSILVFTWKAILIQMMS